MLSKFEAACGEKRSGMKHSPVERPKPLTLAPRQRGRVLPRPHLLCFSSGRKAAEQALDPLRGKLAISTPPVDLGAGRCCVVTPGLIKLLSHPLSGGRFTNKSWWHTR
jgi:hypothetical protein